MAGGIEPGTIVLAVTSGKGGVGKSTVSLNLALALAAEGRAVGVLDADFYAPDIPLMVNLKRTPRRQRWMLGRVGGIALDPVERFGLGLMSIGFLIGEDQALSMGSPLLQGALLQLVTGVRWGPLDYLVVDLPPGTADLQQEVLSLVPVSGALLVVGPQDLAHLDARRVLDMLRAAGVDVVGGVENMAAMRCPHCGEPVEVFPAVRPERSIWGAGVQRLVSIPLDPAVARAGDRGVPIVLGEPAGPQAAAYRKLALRVGEWTGARPLTSDPGPNAAGPPPGAAAEQ